MNENIAGIRDGSEAGKIVLQEFETGVPVRDVKVETACTGK